MNTPAHAIINLLLFKKKQRQHFPIAIILGAYLPDAPMLLFYLWAKLKHLPENIIWSQTYFESTWQAVFDIFHSFPLLVTAYFIAWRAKISTLTIVLLSMLLHGLFDYPVHHHDAHRHFYPLSDFQFISPISYWNPLYYGGIVGGIEFLIVIAGSLWLLRTHKTQRLRWTILTTLFIYLFFCIFTLLAWKILLPNGII